MLLLKQRDSFSVTGLLKRLPQRQADGHRGGGQEFNVTLNKPDDLHLVVASKVANNCQMQTAQ